MLYNGRGGNSGGPLLAYIGGTFYLIAVLSLGGGATSWYSPICNIKEDNAIYAADEDGKMFELKDNRYVYKKRLEGKEQATLMSLIRQ